MLAKKIATITPSLTLGISTKVNEMKKQGISIINLSIGEPDFHTPMAAKIGGIKAIEANKTRYDAASGLHELRVAICEKLLLENGLEYAPQDIVVTSGAKHAITNALIAITDPGDEILIPKPYWVSYPEMVKLTGGTPVFVETQLTNNFRMTVTELKGAITEHTKALILTNPSNPTGAIYSKDELTAIAELCVAHNICIIADEIYERICYLDSFTSIASLSDEVKKNTIIINGMAKSAAMTGWRIGYTASSKELAAAMGMLQGHLVSHPATISQYAALHALTDSADEMKIMVDTYRNRRDEIVAILAEIPGLRIVQPDGAFYIFMDLSPIKEKLPHSDSFSVELCNRLLDECQVAFVPGVAFGMDDFIRMSYATDMDSIKEGLRRLKEFYMKVLEG